MKKSGPRLGRYQIRRDYIKVETSIAPQVALTTPTQSDNFLARLAGETLENPIRCFSKEPNHNPVDDVL